MSGLAPDSPWELQVAGFRKIYPPDLPRAPLHHKGPGRARFACAADIPGAAARPSSGACTTTWVGATLTSASDVGLFVANYTGPGARLAPRTIRFTLNGSAPSAASPAYSAPFSLAANATVRSRSFDDATGAPLGPESAATVTLAA